MKTCKYIISLFLLLSFLSCSRNAKRNKIDFQSDIGLVQDSIIKISSLLDKIEDPVKINKGYDFREEGLFINNIHTNAIWIDTARALAKLTKNEKRQFLHLSDFLKRNDITSGSYDPYLGLWTFEYDYLPNGDNEDARVITILNDDDKNRISSKAIILDHQKMTYLLKYR
jgi:hypothetical protein